MHGEPIATKISGEPQNGKVTNLSFWVCGGQMKGGVRSYGSANIELPSS